MDRWIQLLVTSMTHMRVEGWEKKKKRKGKESMNDDTISILVIGYCNTSDGENGALRLDERTICNPFFLPPSLSDDLYVRGRKHESMEGYMNTVRVVSRDPEASLRWMMVVILVMVVTVIVVVTIIVIVGIEEQRRTKTSQGKARFSVM